MKKTLMTATLVAVAVGYLAADGFEVPLPAQTTRSGSGLEKLEFDELLANGVAFAELAERGYYTVVEGYTNSCSICRALERRFPAFLDARRDVVIRKVRFAEENSVPAEPRALERLGSYGFAHLSRSGEDETLRICGTPHVEVYGPDGRLVAGDFCSDTIGKDGLTFLSLWIQAETGS